jgi:hypothetical protein
MPWPHNDRNTVTSILSDNDVGAADLYDIFGFPSADTEGSEKVVIAFTFTSVSEEACSVRTCAHNCYQA